MTSFDHYFLFLIGLRCSANVCVFCYHEIRFAFFPRFNCVWIEKSHQWFNQLKFSNTRVTFDCILIEFNRIVAVKYNPFIWFFLSFVDLRIQFLLLSFDLQSRVIHYDWTYQIIMFQLKEKNNVEIQTNKKWD